MLLTDEEVMDIACQRLSWTDQELIRAIEAAVLAKLREQTPVGEVSAATFVHWKNDKVPKAGTMLFTHPAPSVPDAFQQAHRLAQR